jgi:hypothetical protein
MSKSLKQIYLDAANHIERVGWHQGDMYKREPGLDQDASTLPCCVLGALTVVCTGPANTYPLRVYLGGKYSAVSFNDTPGRTVEEVTAALRGAAATLEG